MKLEVGAAYLDFQILIIAVKILYHERIGVPVKDYLI